MFDVHAHPCSISKWCAGETYSKFVTNFWTMHILQGEEILYKQNMGTDKFSSHTHMHKNSPAAFQYDVWEKPTPGLIQNFWTMHILQGEQILCTNKIWAHKILKCCREHGEQMYKNSPACWTLKNLDFIPPKGHIECPTAGLANILEYKHGVNMINRCTACWTLKTI